MCWAKLASLRIGLESCVVTKWPNVLFRSEKGTPFPRGAHLPLSPAPKGSGVWGRGGRPEGCEVLRWAWGRGTFYSNLLLGGGGGDEGFVRCGPLGGDACCFSGPDPPASPPPTPPPSCSGLGKKG